MVVGAPLVPGVVGPLVVSLTLMTTFSVRVVGIDAAVVVRSVGSEGAVGGSVGAVGLTLMTVVLVVGTVSLGLLIVVSDLSLPSLNGDESSSEKNTLEHFCNNFRLIK